MTEPKPIRAALSLGSNLGDKRGTIARAIAALDAGGAKTVARSADYRTEPWGPVAQDWFVNACVLVETALSAPDLLALCLKVERDLGRIREVKWGPRIIDIDILTYDDVAIDTPELVLPHPFVLERRFVLVPLAEIAPDLAIRGTTVAEALKLLGPGDVTRID
ncbi:2-amino-4-hydroxy-6-hydroxymethyldihydropteridine diphosphokinase [Microvirga puerhi]|uniref:2-amino-4-hydroxy-6-hydroxymethyldihydropteridine pyrophosphokinase n=1 Tax=Microvirga puerhi TaxID=2876078 RepID=A0ABS7VKP9_9HYPH|nr:2-amino-4-hydroxy-6-hydroxymethyldihydropteridine diphosphokinase [Microvirga puerhi]MBZ6075645.1 2-amino-4-hydroxy-6-hydroxymethyldihydropteridine diphosphokinase [Microvirga puerhi]